MHDRVLNIFKFFKVKNAIVQHFSVLPSILASELESDRTNANGTVRYNQTDTSLQTEDPETVSLTM